MRPNHQRRQRGRNGKPNKFPNRNQSYDSNGPDVRVRGTAHQIFEKYQALAREAATSGDRVMAEAYYQHAEHYYRIIQAQGGFIQPRYPQPWEESEAGDDGGAGAGDGQQAEGGTAGGGLDPTEVPQPSVDYPQRNAGFAAGDDEQGPRDGGYNGEERYRGRDDGRGFDPRRQERRDDDGGYGQQGQQGQRGRRDFVTRAEQRYQDRQERPDRQDRQDRQDRYDRGPPADGAAPVNESTPSNGDAGEPANVAPQVDVAAGDGQGGDGRGPREGRQFRPRHPHFRRFRGGQRGQSGVDPAQEDQPDLTGGQGGSGGTGTSS
ncbi:MAG TPA: DUF4167 domain-containing protein [Vineibacter sp.]|nr:DUF4167 domain-containing protein [Vineibacter sp.]